MFLTICSQNEEIVKYRNELLELSEHIRFATWSDPELKDVFQLNGGNIDDILEEMSIQLEKKFICECTGPYTSFNHCEQNDLISKYTRI